MFVVSSERLKRNSSTWFVLPTEIVNIQQVCNIPVSEKVVELFTYKKPELCVLHKLDVNELKMNVGATKSPLSDATVLLQYVL